MKSNISAALAALAFLTACDIDVNLSEDDYRQRLVVNGVTWASCNVSVPGMFTPNEEDYGGHFDFESAQSVCPAGWQIPTQKDWAELLSIEHYWSIECGIRGLKLRLGDRFLFLPGGGSGSENTLSHVGTRGYYWSSTPGSVTSTNEKSAYSLLFNERASGTNDINLQSAGFSVRCVKK